MPGDDDEQLNNLPAPTEMIDAAFLDAFDQQRQVDSRGKAHGTACRAQPLATDA